MVTWMLRAVLVVAGAAGSTHADVVFSNFGPGNTYLGNTGWTVVNISALGGHIEESVSFTVPIGEALRLDMVEIAIGHLFGPNLLDARLHADSGGTGPGAVLEMITVVDQMLPMPTEPNVNNPLVVLGFSGASVLQPGGQYWISVSTATTEKSWAAWNENITGDQGLRAYRVDGSAWNLHAGNPRGAFRVHASPVPGPAGVMALGVAGSVAARERRARPASPGRARRAT